MKEHERDGSGVAGILAGKLAAAVLCWLIAIAIASSCAWAGTSVRWLGTQELGSVGYEPSNDAALVSAPAGRSAVAWGGREGLMLALARPGGRFGRPVRLDERIDSRPMIAIDDRGDVVVAWSYSDESVMVGAEPREFQVCCDHVRVAMVRRNGRVVSRQTLTPAKRAAEVQGVAISPNGSTVAVSYAWRPISALERPYLEVEETHVAVRVAAFAGRFDHSALLGTGGRSVLLRALRGRAAVVYDEELSSDEQEAIVSRRGRILVDRHVGGVAVRPLSGIAVSALPGEPDLPSVVAAGMDAHGDAAVLLVEPPQGEIGAGRLLVMLRHGVGRFATHVLDGDYRGWIWAPSLAVAPSGRLLAVWETCCERRLAVASGHLRGSPKLDRVAAPPPLPRRQALHGATAAVDARGRGLLIVAVGAPIEFRSTLIAVPRSADGRFGRSREIEPTTFATGDPRPHVTIDGRGRGVFVWRSTSRELLATRFRIR